MGGEEHCKRIVVDLQDVMKKPRKTNVAALETVAIDSPQQPQQALAVPSGRPMSIFHAATYPACYVEFLYAD